MTKEALAALLNDREYKQEMSEAEIAMAKENHLVVVYGHSDDTTTIRGAITADVKTVNGGVIALLPTGVFEECPCDCVHARWARAQAKEIIVHWCKGPYVWHYETDIPCVSFEIKDNQPAENLKFCQGIVFDLSVLSS